MLGQRKHLCRNARFFIFPVKGFQKQSFSCWSVWILMLRKSAKRLPRNRKTLMKWAIEIPNKRVACVLQFVRIILQSLSLKMMAPQIPAPARAAAHMASNTRGYTKIEHSIWLKCGDMRSSTNWSKEKLSFLFDILIHLILPILSFSSLIMRIIWSVLCC